MTTSVWRAGITSPGALRGGRRGGGGGGGGRRQGPRRPGAAAGGSGACRKTVARSILAPSGRRYPYGVSFHARRGEVSRRDTRVPAPRAPRRLGRRWGAGR